MFTYILSSTEMVPSSRNYWESELIEVKFGYGLDLSDRFLGQFEPPIVINYKGIIFTLSRIKSYLTKWNTYGLRVL